MTIDGEQAGEGEVLFSACWPKHGFLRRTAGAEERRLKIVDDGVTFRLVRSEHGQAEVIMSSGYLAGLTWAAHNLVRIRHVIPPDWGHGAPPISDAGLCGRIGAMSPVSGVETSAGNKALTLLKCEIGVGQGIEVILREGFEVRWIDGEGPDGLICQSVDLGAVLLGLCEVMTAPTHRAALEAVLMMERNVILFDSAPGQEGP